MGELDVFSIVTNLIMFQVYVLALLNVMLVMILVAVLDFLFIDGREMHLCASLIKQKEATHQAERKNMNNYKSLAVASASHDVRTSLAGITALIKISSKLVPAGSELASNLIQMEDCTQDLQGNDNIGSFDAAQIYK